MIFTENSSPDSSESTWKQCARCVMDTSAADIFFDENGFCNYCAEFLNKFGRVLFEDKVEKQEKLIELVNRVREAGKGKPYDCLVGVS